MAAIETAAKQADIALKEGEGDRRAQSVRLLADYLERNPSALIFGKPKLNERE